jgi:hypothetical protein
MFALSAPNWLTDRWPALWLRPSARPPANPRSLSGLMQIPDTRLPRFVQESELAMKYRRLLRPLDWSRFPDRPDLRFHPDDPPLSYAPLVAAYLVKIDRHLTYMADLRDFLLENPALVWVLGFPLTRSSAFSWGFDVRASLPTHRHLSRLLRGLPNSTLQFLLDDAVRLFQTALRDHAPLFGDCISLDTKHIIAWVQENNPKAYVREGRYDKTKQPNGDPDCRLGCKRKHNQVKGQSAVESLPTPTTNPVPAKHLAVGEYYWGYGSGIVATKVPGWGEFILAELTQPFDQPDVSYFQPLMADVERRLGRRPRFGAFDAAFDAFYVYEYFCQNGNPWTDGFAAVPFVARGGHGHRSFSDDGRPLCAAGLPMTLRSTFWCKTTLIPHERGQYVCPLRYPAQTGQACPVQHKNWTPKGCVSTLATSPGARLRYQIDRDGELYKQVYKQRTASERINSQAVDLGIERPKLRNGLSIANHNTLTYALIDLHALQRVRQRLAKRSEADPTDERA